MIQDVRSHITPQFYLKRRISNSANQNSVWVHPYNEYQKIWWKSTDSEFFKVKNYYSQIDQYWNIDNSLEQVFSKNYESNFWNFIDNILLKIKEFAELSDEELICEKIMWTNYFVIDDKDEEQMLQFLTYSYLRSRLWEIAGIWLLSSAVEWNSTDIENMKLGVIVDNFNGNIVEKEDNYDIDRSIFNKYILNWPWKDPIYSHFKGINIDYLYAKNTNMKFITTDEIICMNKLSLDWNNEYIIPLDPELAIWVWNWNRTTKWVVYIGEEKIKKINEVIYSWGRIWQDNNWQALPHKCVISNNKEELLRLIERFWEITFP